MSGIITFIFEKRRWVAPIIFIIVLLVSLMNEQLKKKFKEIIKNRDLINAVMISAIVTSIIFMFFRWLELRQFEGGFFGLVDGVLIISIVLIGLFLIDSNRE